MSVKIQSYENEIEEYAQVATYVQTLIETQEYEPKDIAIIAKTHNTLQSIATILNSAGIDINYDKKENILNNPNVVWIRSYLKLILNLANNKHEEVDYLIPEILSHEFWQLHPFIIYDISLKSYREKKNWLEIMKDYTCETFEDTVVNIDVSKKIREIAYLFLFLKDKSYTEPVEVLLDYILGNQKVSFNEEKKDSENNKSENVQNHGNVESFDNNDEIEKVDLESYNNYE